MQSVINLVQRFNENVEYYIFCGNKDLDGELLFVPQTNQWTDYNPYTKVWYASGKNMGSDMRQQIKIIQPSALFIIGIFSWQYNVKPLFFSGVPLKILSVRGMLHKGALSQKKLKKMIFLFGLKLSGITRSIRFHATDGDEKLFIEKQFGKNKNIKVAANFASLLPFVAPAFKEKNKLSLMSVALISPMKNHLLVMEALRECTQEIDWNIYGPVKDAAYWQACMAALKKLPANINVVFHGDLVPAKKTTAFEANHVFILPSRSENFGHAFTEAFSAGRPVITSNGTPWNNLAQEKAGVNVEPGVAKIAAAVQFFAAMNNEEYQKYCYAATEYVGRHLDEQSLTKAYKNLFEI